MITHLVNFKPFLDQMCLVNYHAFHSFWYIGDFNSELKLLSSTQTSGWINKIRQCGSFNASIEKLAWYSPPQESSTWTDLPWTIKEVKPLSLSFEVWSLISAFKGDTTEMIALSTFPAMKSNVPGKTPSHARRKKLPVRTWWKEIT